MTWSSNTVWNKLNSAYIFTCRKNSILINSTCTVLYSVVHFLIHFITNTNAYTPVNCFTYTCIHSPSSWKKTKRVYTTFFPVCLLRCHKAIVRCTASCWHEFLYIWQWRSRVGTSYQCDTFVVLLGNFMLNWWINKWNEKHQFWLFVEESMYRDDVLKYTLCTI